MFFCVLPRKRKKERRNFTIPFDSKSHYKFTGINTSIFLADISWKSWIPILPFCRFPRCTLLPIPPIHIPMLNNISLFTHFLPFVSSASPLYLFLHPTFLSSFLLVFLLSFFFYLISIHSTEYTFLPFLSFQSFLFLHQIPSCSFLSRFLFQHGPLSHVDIFIGHILHFIQRFPLFHPWKAPKSTINST